MGGPGRRASAGRSFLLVAASPGAGCTGIPAPLLRGCFFGDPLSQQRPSVGGRISGNSERRKRHQLRMYQTSISTCGFFSMETQGQGQSPGAPSTLCGRLFGPHSWCHPSENQTDFSLCQTVEWCFENIYQQAAALGGKPRNNLTGINIKTYTNKYGVRLNNRPSEKD